MSNISKGIKLNEVDPRNFDSDIDYYNALNKPPRRKGEDDYVEPYDDEPIKFQQNPNARPQYSISKDEDKSAGYNMTLTVKAPTTQKAQWAAESYVDSEWGAKKQIGKITPVGDGVVQVHMLDNHKHGYWKPWADEPPISKGISFGESKETNVSVLTEARIYKLWENAGSKLMEAQLTADQINQIFQQVEQGATDAGGNRTMLGKGKDAASAVNKAWEDLKTKVQDSGPIKNVDAMYDKAAEQLKQATGGDQGVMQYVQKYRDFAKKHPIAQSLIYSALIAAAGISGAGVGGAAALGLFKMVDKLLQGEKFSSAAYQGAKTGGMAYAAGQIGKAMRGDHAQATGGQQPAAGTSSADDHFNKGMAQARARIDAANAKLGVDPTASNIDASGTYSSLANDPALSPIQQKLAADLAAGKHVQGADEFIRKGMETAARKAQMMGDMPDGTANAGMQQFQALERLQNAMMDNAGGAAGQAATDTASNIAGSAVANADIVGKAVKGAGMSPDYLQKVISGEIPRPMISPEQAQAALDWQAQNGGQVASAAADTATNAAKGFSKEYLMKAADPNRFGRFLISPEKAQELLGQMNESKNLSESQIYYMIGKIVERQRKLNEGIMDTIKGAAGQAANWAATKGHNLTTKITADKLLQAWKKAGSPTDSLDVASIIQKAGVPSDTIKQVYGAMKIPFAGEPGAGASIQRKIDVDPSSTAPAPGVTEPAVAASAPAQSTSPAAAPAGSAPQQQQTMSTYQEVKKLVDQLDKRNKQRVIVALKKDLQLAEDQLDELSPATLASYKKKAGAQASALDKAAWAGQQPTQQRIEKANKRFSGIVRATKKEFDNDAKGIREDAEGLNVGDPVIITGDVQYKGKTGDIVGFGKDNRFVIVDLYNHGKHSFHSSDVSFNDYADSDDEQEYSDSIREGKVKDALIKGTYGKTAGETKSRSGGMFSGIVNARNAIEKSKKSQKPNYNKVCDMCNRAGDSCVCEGEAEDSFRHSRNQTPMADRIRNSMRGPDVGDQVELTTLKGRVVQGILDRVNPDSYVLKVAGTTGSQHGLGDKPSGNILVIKKDRVKSMTPVLDEDLPPPENARKTQIAGTLPTYKKAADILNKTGVQGKALDFGAGLGMGTAELGKDAHSYEPFPGEKFKPHFVDVTKIPDNSYHKIVNLNVLNVVPNVGEHKIRDSIVKNIGRVLAPGGVALITTRGKDVLTIKGTPGEEPMSMISKIGTYQKGFSQSELKQYIQSVLGDGFEVSSIKLGPAGVMIKKLDQEGVTEDSDSGIRVFKISKGDVVRDRATDYLFATETGRWYTRPNRWRQGGMTPKWVPARVVPRHVRAALPGDSDQEGVIEGDNQFNRMINKITSPKAIDTREAIAMMDELIYQAGASYREALDQASMSYEMDKAKLHDMYQQHAKGLAEDWQKVNKKDKTDGMSRKAVKAYRRENPGSKLKTAVTTKPSKLKKGSKAANRRKSFCARMSGMKKAHASAKTKRDPDSPINKALRRWNCESIEQMHELMMIAEQKIQEAKNAKQQAAIAIAKKAGKK